VSIKDATDAVNTQLTVVLSGLGETVPTFGFGEADLYLEGDAPRLVWVPQGGPADSKIIPAADNGIQFGTPPAYPTPRPLWTRHVTVQAHVWAVRANATPAGSDPDRSKDYAAAEVLAQHILAACQFVGWGSVRPKSEAWPRSQASTETRGVELVVAIEFDLPWVDETETLAEIDTVEVTVGAAHS
jgi:hypothetical protein